MKKTKRGIVAALLLMFMAVQTYAQEIVATSVRPRPTCRSSAQPSRLRETSQLQSPTSTVISPSQI
nr:hypothetical protein [Prevotella corporis]